MNPKGTPLCATLGGIAMLVAVSCLPAAAHGSEGDSGAVDRDLEVIRERVIAYVMRFGVDEARVARLVTAIAPDGSWPGINYSDVSRTGFQHSEHLGNMLRMAIAYKKPGNRFTGSPELRRAIHAALDFWITHDFRCENWWWNDMGTPLSIINLLLVMDTDLTDAQRAAGLRIAGRAHMKSTGARPGGDLIRVATIWGKQGVFSRHAAVVEDVVAIMAAEMQTTMGRGLKPDLSHHHRHDRVISTLSYGLYLPSQFSVWSLFIEGTRFSLPRPAMELLVDFFLDGICRSMAHGRYPDPGAKNRGLSRRGALNPFGPEMAENLYRASHYRREELRTIAEIRRGRVEPRLRYTSFFWHSEYFIHQRPGWFASVRMHSARNHNVEYPHNQEGLKNHHLADGANFLTMTGREYADIFPVWDWQRIPGATVVRKPELPHWGQIAKRGRTGFVGGVTDGAYGAAVFDFESVHDPLRARKSWFFFDAEYVCLGSGITAQADAPVHTAINQCYLQGAVHVGRDGGAAALEKGEHALDNVAWVHHDPVAYVFPEAVDARIRHASSAGSWRDITHQIWASDEEIRAELFALWLDHGVRPSGGTYQYVVVPGLELSAVEEYRRALPVRVLSNTASLQAVRHEGLDLVQAVFYAAGKAQLGPGLFLSADKPCAVMVQLRGGVVARITVSDPSRAQAALELVITSRFEGGGENWNAAWKESDGASTVAIGLPAKEWAGKSVVMDAR